MYFNPYMPQNYGTKQEIIKVNGEAGAMSYVLPPNSSCLALDTNSPTVFLLQSDAGGYKTCAAYSITPVQKQAEANIHDLSERITRLEGIINESNIGSIARRTTPAEQPCKPPKPAQRADARESRNYVSADDEYESAI